MYLRASWGYQAQGAAKPLHVWPGESAVGKQFTFSRGPKIVWTTIIGVAGDVKASWGDQMRSYVLNPYQMVKDLRTNHEVGNTSSVFDGEIDDFIEAGIRWRRSKTEG